MKIASQRAPRGGEETAKGMSRGSRVVAWVEEQPDVGSAT
jgi:hypothetical protein